jgi:hypothetical protein
MEKGHLPWSDFIVLGVNRPSINSVMALEKETRQSGGWQSANPLPTHRFGGDHEHYTKYVD